MYKLTTGESRAKYVIICPNDNSGASAVAILANTDKNFVKFEKFSVAYYFGTKTDGLKSVLNYVTTNTKGVP